MKITSIIALILFTAISVFSYDYTDRLDASAQPPGGLSASQVPMFVSIGFDDNSYSGLPRGGAGEGGGVTFVVDQLCGSRKNPAGSGNSATYDGDSITVSFFVNSIYGGGTYAAESPTIIKVAWNGAYKNGHEIGNHTHSHGNGSKSSVEGWSQSSWDNEIETCNDWLTKPLADTSLNNGEAFWSSQIMGETGTGIDPADIIGYRNPFLAYQPETFITLKKYGFVYDCSIEEGYKPDQDGTNYLWPYTLHDGSPGHDYLVSQGTKNFDIGTHDGLWEMGIRPVIIPPNDLCESYNVPSGLRDKIAGQVKEGNPDGIKSTGKLTGLDYNLWFDAKVTKAEFLAIMKYTLDLRLAGNRCPFLFGAHSDEYSSKWSGNSTAIATINERMEALEEFFDYALSNPAVRIASYEKILSWIKNPVPISGTEKQNSSLASNPIKVSNVTITNSKLSLTLSEKAKNDISVTLLSVNGQIISSKNIPANSSRTIHFEKPLSTGVYLINLISGKINHCERVIVR